MLSHPSPVFLFSRARSRYMRACTSTWWYVYNFHSTFSYFVARLRYLIFSVFAQGLRCWFYFLSPTFTKIHPLIFLAKKQQTKRKRAVGIVFCFVLLSWISSWYTLGGVVSAWEVLNRRERVGGWGVQYPGFSSRKRRWGGILIKVLWYIIKPLIIKIITTV